jgi:hypothetical protein
VKGTFVLPWRTLCFLYDSASLALTGCWLWFYQTSSCLCYRPPKPQSGKSASELVGTDSPTVWTRERIESPGYRLRCTTHSLARSARHDHATTHHTTHTTHTHTRAARVGDTSAAVAALCGASSIFSRDDQRSTASHCIHQSCCDADVDPIILISMHHSAYTCNSTDTPPLLITLERRLGNFPVFSLLFSPLQLLTTPLILHRSR